MLVESQQLTLCVDLLDAGYTVYIDDIEPVIDTISENLTHQYGNRVRFGKPQEEVYKVEF